MRRLLLIGIASLMIAAGGLGAVAAPFGVFAPTADFKSDAQAQMAIPKSGPALRCVVRRVAP